MGKKREKHPTATRSSQTLPPSPSHSFSSSSSSDFEFTISLSPRTNSFNTSLCPADELFYKGQLLPLHLSPRISMVRTLLLASSSTSSSSGLDSTTTASRDSTASSVDQYCGTDPSSGRPSSVADDDGLLHPGLSGSSTRTKRNKYFSLSRFSSVFKKESKNKESLNDVGSGPVKWMSSSAREVIRKYLKKVKPLYEKLSSPPTKIRSVKKTPTCDVVSSDNSNIANRISDASGGGRRYFSHSFSGNLRYPMGKKKDGHVSSCPSSMLSSPSHSGFIATTGCSSSGGIIRANSGGGLASIYNGGGDTASSSMEELQSAIEGAIAHCKNSLLEKQHDQVQTSS